MGRGSRFMFILENMSKRRLVGMLANYKSDLFRSSSGRIKSIPLNEVAYLYYVKHET